MKPEKFKKLVDEIEEFLGEHQRSNPHYLFDEDIINIFSRYDKKDVKKALKEVR